jgi:hypothetical protein
VRLQPGRRLTLNATGYSRPASADEIAELARLRTALAPEGGFQTVDDFGKWLFGGAALVGTVATGFGVSGFGDLQGIGQKFFFAAIAAAALSFGLVVVSLKPARLDFNPNSVESMRGAIQTLVNHRARYIKAAAWLFAAALIAAGVAPIVSRDAHEVPGVSFAVSDKGALSVHLSVEGARPGSVIRAWLASKHLPAGMYFPRARALAARDGRAIVEFTMAAPKALQAVTLVASWSKKGQDGRHIEHYRIVLPHKNLAPPKTKHAS